LISMAKTAYGSKVPVLLKACSSTIEVDLQSSGAISHRRTPDLHRNRY